MYLPCRQQQVSWYHVHGVQLGWCSAVSAAAAAAAGTHKHAAVVPADVVSVPARCDAVPLDVCLALWTSVSVAPPRCVTSHALDPTQTYRQAHGYNITTGRCFTSTDFSLWKTYWDCRIFSVSHMYGLVV